MFLFDKNNYYLWGNNWYTKQHEDGKYFGLFKMQEGKLLELFKYEHRTPDEIMPRFYMIDEQSCYTRPIEGEDIVYKIKKDTLISSFHIDFGQMAMSKNEIDELLINKSQSNSALKSNKYKSISIVLEVEDYIYFRFTGPNSFSYDGLISKHTGDVKTGLAVANPRFFFSDGKFLYCYYEQYIIDRLREDKVEHCFDTVWLNNQYDIEDNIVLVKIHLK